VPLGKPREMLWGEDMDGPFNLAQSTHDYSEMTAVDEGVSNRANAAFLESLLAFGTAIVKNSPPGLQDYESECSTCIVNFYCKYTTLRK